MQVGLESRTAPRYGRLSSPVGAVVPGAGLYVALGTSTCICGEANVRRNILGSLPCSVMCSTTCIGSMLPLMSSFAFNAIVYSMISCDVPINWRAMKLKITNSRLNVERVRNARMLKGP
ncbi:hypothetical protein C8Q74DRAFT_286717 [Fomes fomentarius]|nr:hypothetical protein C8Q74DRAFT_286717 [Fomes fomentarius]